LKFGGRAEFGAFDPMTTEHIQAYLGHGNIQRTVLATPNSRLRGSRISGANERTYPRAGRTTDNLLPGCAESGPTLISIEIWPDAASAENAFRSGLVTWENDQHPPDAPVVY
jgi:hypothetical protein